MASNKKITFFLPTGQKVHCARVRSVGKKLLLCDYGISGT